jgi:hypothetical protein
MGLTKESFGTLLLLPPTFPATPDGRVGPAVLPVSLSERVLVSGEEMGLEGHRGGPAHALSDPGHQYAR